MRDPELPTMEEALVWLKDRSVPHKKHTGHHIKIGRDLSWWPAKGTIVIDGAKARYAHSGKSALEKLLIERKVMP